MEGPCPPIFIVWHISFLVFDFGGDGGRGPTGASSYRGFGGRGSGWTRNCSLKFERKDLEAKQDTPAEPPAKASKGSSKGKGCIEDQGPKPLGAHRGS